MDEDFYLNLIIKRLSNALTQGRKPTAGNLGSGIRGPSANRRGDGRSWGKGARGLDRKAGSPSGLRIWFSGRPDGLPPDTFEASSDDTPDAPAEVSSELTFNRKTVRKRSWSWFGLGGIARRRACSRPLLIFP